MDMRRKAALAASALGIALGAGHLVQQDGETRQARAEAPTAIVQLAATDPAPAPEPLPAPPAPVLADLAPRLPVPPVAATPAPPAATATAPAAECGMTLAVSTGPRATLDVSLLAPCHPDARVVLRHAGLALTARTSQTGSLFLSLPALDSRGEVAVRFGNGQSVDTLAPVDLTGIRRVAVQWQAADRFALNVYENGAEWGEPGHWSADIAPSATARPAGSFAALGDPSVSLPMLAEVYTFPADGTPALATVEAKVTPATCGRELLGEALDSRDGRVTTADLTLAMPGCDAMGDFLVLNNLWSGTTLAAAE
jgi:hypothetical protein